MGPILLAEIQKPKKQKSKKAKVAQGWASGRTMPVSGNSFPFSFHGTFLSTGGWCPNSEP
jgi:hypothetical protein